MKEPVTGQVPLKEATMKAIRS